MKKSLKRTCAIALAVAATAGVSGVDKLASIKEANYVSNTSIVYAEGEVTAGVLKITNFSKTAEVGVPYTLPTATYEGNAISKLKVTGPAGQEVTPKDGKVDIDGIGKYTITYFNNSDEELGSVNFTASLLKYELSIEQNKATVLPSKIGSNFAGTINFPKPIIGGDVNEQDYSVEITLQSESGILKTATKDAEGNYSCTIAKGDFIANKTYYVIYTLYHKGHYIDRIEHEIKCVDGNAYANDAKLSISYSKEKPETLNIGKTVELPAVTAKVGKENVPVYYSVQVFKGTSTTEYAVEGKTVLKQNESGAWEFTPYEKATYTFKYTVKSALGLVEQTTAEFSVKESNVKDDIKPTPIVVEKSYSVTETEGLKDASYALASVIHSSQVMKILPIYATDLASEKFEDFTFKRIVKNASGKIMYEDEVKEGEGAVANKVVVLNAPDNYEAGAGEIIGKKEDKNIKLPIGSYTVYYTAVDKAGNKTEDVYHSFKVSSDYDATVAPEVKIEDNFLASIDAGEKIEFSNVSFTDKHDTRLLKEVAYKYTYNDGTEKTTEEKSLELENGKYVVDTAKIKEVFGNIAGVQSVTIIARATNDAGKTTEVSETIKINSPDRVITPTTIVDDGGITAPINLDLATLTDAVTIPSVKFENDPTGSLKVTTSVVCTPTGEDAKPFEVDAYQDGAMGIYPDVYMYQNVKFTPSVTGTYKVAVRAEDDANNVIIKYFTYNVTDSVRDSGELRFTKIGLTDVTVELGETYVLPQPDIYGENWEDYDWRVRRISGPTNCEVEKDRFVAYKTGDYVLEYFMFSGDKTSGYTEKAGVSVKVNITVQDTTNPELFVDWQTSLVNDDEIAKSQIAKAYDEGTSILLPMFSASDLSGINEEESIITISTTASGVGVTTIKFKDMVKEHSESGVMNYTFSKSGEYTIKYTVKDLAGKTTTKEYTIKIGDTDAPVLTVSDKIAKSEYKVGDTISFSLNNDEKNYFDITDAKDTEIEKSDISVKLMVNNADKTKDFNTATEDGVYNFNLSEAGEYQLVFTVKDSAGNISDEVVKTFTIEEKSSEPVSTAKVVGIVLIVVSVVVLAGVVVYFIISKRKMDKLYKS